MIIGVGTDLVACARINHIYEKFGDRFIDRIFNDDEKILLDASPTRFLNRLSLGYAAKEATAKALGCGISSHCHFHDITILRDDKGAPYVTLNHHADDYLNMRIDNNKPYHINISLANDGGFAQAMIVIWC